MSDRQAFDDEAARVAIRTELDTTMLVEAGAGAGKTTLIVERLVAYLARGTPVDTLAAVTFTRKAAHELRERLESRLELESQRVDRPADEAGRLQQALEHRDRMFIGTLHAFCARVLREHALDAGLPPDFAELDETASADVRSAAWRAFLANSARDNSAVMANVITLGIDPISLSRAFAERERYRDVRFPSAPVTCPPHERVRNELVLLLEEGRMLRATSDGSMPESVRDPLQETLDELWRRYLAHDRWANAAAFAHDVAPLLTPSRLRLTQKHWADSAAGKKAAKQYADSISAWVQQQLQPWCTGWWAHAYPAVIALLDAASSASLIARRRAGQLGFDDLLTETARLLRERPDTRRALGARWQHVLVDEFQDTDPVQAEVCFLLASEADTNLTGDNDWRTVPLRRGGLFVVGDPKQSIYRFRRADLATYRLVHDRVAQCGRVLHLTRNFRSVPAIGALVNAHFGTVFPQPHDVSPAARHQAPFAEFVSASARVPHSESGIWHYHVGPAALASKDALVAEDARRVASWIAARCNVLGDRLPQDFLVLTSNKRELTQYARELALRNIPATVTGATGTVDEVLHELLVILHALANPDDAVAVIAALEGWTAGCSHVELWEARQLGLEFGITRPPVTVTVPVGAALQQLHSWWRASQQLPAASVLERVMEESGLLVLAASSELGDRSAGQMLQLVSTVRASAAGTSVQAALTIIEEALAREDVEPTLRTGCRDAVRVMNLHKAKGLEAPVVILAAPVPQGTHAPTVAVWRDASDTACGALEVQDDAGRVLARPADWEARAADETARLDAERHRLLYVAVTRAEEELVIARRTPYALKSGEPRGDEGRWAPLAALLDTHGRHLAVMQEAPPDRPTVETDAAEMLERIAATERRRADSMRPRYTVATVTEPVKRDAASAAADGTSLATLLDDDDMARDDDAHRFGALVHAAIEGALRGRDAAQLAAYVEALVWHATPHEPAEARDGLVRQVLDVVAEAERSPAWQQLAAGTSPVLAELPVAHVTVQDGRVVLSERIIDAVGHDGERWLVVDWRPDRTSDPGWKELERACSAQAAACAATLRDRTGAEAAAQVVRLQAGV